MAQQPPAAQQLPVDELNQALVLFYGPTATPQQRSAADRWLQDFQRTPAAWQLADSILADQTGTVDHNALFFAANTLHFKIANNFHQLPTESQLPLREAVSNHLSRWMLTPGAPRPVVKRLSLCAAALAVQMSWFEVLQAIPAMIAQAPPETSLPITKMAIELLGFLPDECNSMWLDVSDQHRDAFQAQLDQNASGVLAFLSQTASRPDVSTDAAALECVLTCLTTWVRFCKVLPAAELAQQPLLPHTLDMLAASYVPPGLFEAAVDVLVEIFRRFDASPANAPLTAVIVPRVMALQPKYLAEAAAGPAKEDVCRGLVRVFAEMGEAYMQLILEPPADAASATQQLAVAQALLQCSSYPEYDVAKITLFFWFRFVKVWRKIEDDGLRAQHHAAFTPIMLELVHQCLRMLHCPEDIDEYSRDQKDDFATQRQQVCETLYDCVLFLGPVVVMQQLWQALGVHFNNLAQAPTSWHGLEACLFALVDKRLERELVVQACDEIFEQLVGLLQHLESQPVWAAGPRLQYSACQVFGVLAGFLKRHPAHLTGTFSSLFNHLLSRPTAGAAAVAVKEICDVCPAHLGESVLDLYDQVLATSGGTFELQHEVVLLEAAGKVVRTLPLDAVERAVQRMLGPPTQRLQAALADPSTSEARIDAELVRLMAVVKHLRLEQALPPGQPHPLVAFLNGVLWRVLDQTLQQFKQSEKLVEKACRVYKFVIRSCGESFAPCLAAMIEHLLGHFRAVPFPAYLYVASICASEFGPNPQFQALLLQMFSQFSEAAFGGALQSLDAFAAHPDVVEEYYYFVARFMECSPMTFLQLPPPLVAHVINSGVAGLALNHREALCGILTFVQEMVGVALLDPAKQPAAEQLRAGMVPLLEQHGAGVIAGVVGALVSPDKQLDSSIEDKRGNPVDVLWRLAKVNPQLLWTSLTSVVASIDPQLLAAEKREHFFGELSQALQSNKMDVFFDAVIRLTNSVARQTRRLLRQQQQQH